MNAPSIVLACLLGVCLSACSIAPDADKTEPGLEVRFEAMRWSSSVIVTGEKNWKPPRKRGAAFLEIPDDAEAGSATPISEDGYFLTADHVILERANDNILLCYGERNVWRRARIVWRDRNADLVLLHAPMQTPGFFRWASPNEWVPAGSRIFHAGIVTGQGALAGSLLTDLKPQHAWTGSNEFKIDVKLQPGDSGGAVLDANGRLLGINTAVEYLMPSSVFMDSEGVRPNIGKLDRLMARDRERQQVKSRLVSDRVH